MRGTFSLITQKRAARLIVAATCFGVYTALLYAPVDPQTGQGSRQIVFNMGTVVDGIETKIDAIAVDSQGTFTALDAVFEKVCTIDSKIDVLESKVDVIDASLDACCLTLNSKVDVIDSKVDVIDVNVDACCATLNSKVDELFVDFQETWTILGNQDQASSASTAFTTAASIDSAQLTIIQWLKTIYRQQRGF